jgi:hypothetical protein
MRRSGAAAFLSFWALLMAATLPASASDGTRAFLHISDIHLDPFTPFDGQAMSPYGEDTNFALFASSLREIGEAGAAADFAVVTGDLLAHDFQEKVAAKIGASATKAQIDDYAARTTGFVADALGQALPGKPVILALGNNDSDCGDYRIEPGGPYLNATRDLVRRLVGSDLVAPDFDVTYDAGGYYAMRHPTVASVQIIVLNDVLWSAEYRDVCGDGGKSAAHAMLAWLEVRLAEQRDANRKVWLVHHIPIGIDAFATMRSKQPNCQDRAVSFLASPFDLQYPKLLRDYSAIIQANLTGHVHFDGYRLLFDAAEKAVGVEKIAPGISPIFGQNPGFHSFDYDPLSGVPVDFTTIYLSNLMTAASPSAGNWQVEYRFTAAYNQKRYDANAVAAMWQSISEPSPLRDTYQVYYDVGSPKFNPTVPPPFFCAIGRLEQSSFSSCACNGQGN